MSFVTPIPFNRVVNSGSLRALTPYFLSLSLAAASRAAMPFAAPCPKASAYFPTKGSPNNLSCTLPR